MFYGMSWPQPVLAPDESIQFQERANWSRGGVARGGTLVLTNARFIFQPNSVEAGIGLTAASWDRASITYIGFANRSLRNPLSGGFRRRLQITMGNQRERFVIADVEAVASELRRLLGVLPD